MSVDSDLIHTRFLAQADHYGDKAAVITPDGAVSYDQLSQRVEQAAAAIDAAHMRRVALCLRNGPEVAEAFFAALLGGAIAMVWDPDWPEDIASHVRDVHQPDFVADDTWPEWRAASSATGQTIQSQPNADMPFLMGFTSGSSGRPKAFIRNHRSWTESFNASAQEFGLGPEDRVAIPGPMSHGLSLYALIEALCVGATVLTQAGFEQASFQALMREHDATCLVGSPVLVDMVCEDFRGDAARSVVTAGDKLTPSTRATAEKAFPRAEIIEYYGASELSFVAVAKSNEKAPIHSVGRAFAGVEIEIRDTNGSCLPADQEGEVWVRSGMICNGYVGDAPAAFRKDGEWASVGDIGVLSPEGWLTLTGRANGMIITAGLNVAPQAVEAVLSDVCHAPVAVIGSPDPRWGQIVCAVKESEANWTQDERNTASEAVLNRLPRHNVPRKWLKVEELPRLSSGKVDRRTLTRQLALEMDSK